MSYYLDPIQYAAEETNFSTELEVYSLNLARQRRNVDAFLLLFVNIIIRIGCRLE